MHVKEESRLFASSTKIYEHWCRRVPEELITIIIIFLQFTIAFDGWWRPLIVLLLFFPTRSFSLFFPICVWSLLLSTKIGDTTLYILRTGEIDIYTRVSLACELSCIAYKHIEICFFLLSSSSHSHLCSLSSCVLMCDGGGVCILIYENRSTACARRAGARDSPFAYSSFSSPHCSPFSLTARTICSSYLSVRGFAST